VLVTMGLMGTGKTTVAQAVAGELGMQVLSSDAIRKELSSANGSGAAYGEGIYSPTMTDRAYEEMFRRARQGLAGGASVVLDATFKLRRHRAAVQSICRKAGADCLFIECVCPELDAIARLDRRCRTEQNISDARPELYDNQRAEFEPTDELPAGEHLVLDTRGDVPGLARSVLKALRGRLSAAEA
jgi:predicted kinase